MNDERRPSSTKPWWLVSPLGRSQFTHPQAFYCLAYATVLMVHESSVSLWRTIQVNAGSNPANPMYFSYFLCIDQKSLFWSCNALDSTYFPLTLVLRLYDCFPIRLGDTLFKGCRSSFLGTAQFANWNDQCISKEEWRLWIYNFFL